MLREREIHFRALGSKITLIHEDQAAIDEARQLLVEIDKKLSRFKENSELSQLNRNTSEQVRVSPLLYRALEEALRSAKLSGGIVDPTMLQAIEDAGYKSSWKKSQAISPKELQRMHPRTPPASPGYNWEKISLLPDFWIKRPPGLRIDLGGTGKGLAADILADHWQGWGTWCVNLGGDMRVAGIYPREVHIVSPWGKYNLSISEGALATSGVYRRAWIKNGVPQNHLLDPQTGKPVWGEFLQATALAKTACEAETRARWALLCSDPEPLREKGGLLLDWSGEWKSYG